MIAQEGFKMASMKNSLNVKRKYDTIDLRLDMPPDLIVEDSDSDKGLITESDHGEAGSSYATGSTRGAFYHLIPHLLMSSNALTNLSTYSHHPHLYTHSSYHNRRN